MDSSVFLLKIASVLTIGFAVWYGDLLAFFSVPDRNPNLRRYQDLSEDDGLDISRLRSAYLSWYYFYLIMIIISILSLLLSNAVTLRPDLSIEVAIHRDFHPSGLRSTMTSFSEAISECHSGPDDMYGEVMVSSTGEGARCTDVRRRAPQGPGWVHDTRLDDCHRSCQSISFPEPPLFLTLCCYGDLSTPLDAQGF